MTTATRSRIPRIAALVLAAALAGVVAPVAAGGTPLTAAAPAYAAGGDVCDICSVNFDLGACERLGGWPYDSTLEDPPPAVLAASNPKPAAPAPAAPAPAAPAPAAPAPAAPAAPAPANPAKPNTSNGGAANTGTAPTQNEQPAVVNATAPAAPTALAHTIAGRVLTLTWAAPADGGSALTGYKLVLNGGTPIAVPAGVSEYEITLGAGTYEAALIASNAVGDSDGSAVLSDIEIVAATASATPEPSSDAIAASRASDSAPSPLIGVLTLGALVVVGGALVGWWWLRRRRAASATPSL